MFSHAKVMVIGVTVVTVREVQFQYQTIGGMAIAYSDLSIVGACDILVFRMGHQIM